MTKISTYTLDEKITALDKWIGSDVNMQNRTKNFTPKKLAEYFNENQVINIGVPLQYKYYTLDPLEERPNGTLTFETEIGPTVNFSAVTTFLLSKYTTKQNIVSDFLNFLDGCKVLLFKSSDINSFGFYRISNIEPYEPDPNFFVVTVDYETGNGFMQEDNDYMLSLVSLPGGAIPTKTSELINDGDNGINPFISEVDINRTEWNAAYDGKINSAEVTGTSTKTLTLTKQDGSTIEASWTDDNTDAVTSVFGRTGDVTAQYGDYNTGQITEVTNKKYQTDNQALFNDATSSIQTQLNSKQPSLGYTPVPNTRTITINGTSYDLSANRSWTIDTNSAVWGNISGTLSNQTDLQIALNAKVPYSGATGNINLGEYGLTSGYYKFDLTPTGTPTSLGTMYWDSFYRTVSLIDGDGDTTLQIGQEERVLVHNNTGSTLTDGQVVYVTGSTGELPSVSLASNISEVTSSVTFGVVTEAILNGADGFITTSGIIHGLNTLSYNEGSAIWLGSTPGTFTQTKPVAPLNSVLVGYVIKKSGGNGSIFVKIQNGYELEELHDVLINNVSGNEILAYEGSPTNLWKNKSVIDVLGFTPYNSTNPSNYISLTALSSTATGLSYNNTNGVFNLTSGYVIPTTTEESNWNTAYSNRITSASLPLSISSNSISISQATSATNGYLTSSDWNTFNNKQAAGNYITALTGEATASGPGSASITLSNSAVTGKLLTGVNITGGNVVDTDSILTAFGKLQNQINGLIGGSIYQGTWNASTNTPSLSSGVGTKGYYYIVNVAGSTNLDGITDWNVGDWAIYDGTAWQQVDNTDAVVSVNGFTGAVSLTTSNISEGVNLYYTESRVSSNADVAANTAARHNAVTIGTANGLSLSTQVLSLGLASSSTNGALSSTDWNTFNNKQSALSGIGFVKISGTTITYDNTTYYPASNPSGYTTNTGTVTSVSGTGGYGGLTLSGSVTTSGSLTLGGTPTGTWPISVSGNANTATNANYANASGVSDTTLAVSGTINYIPKFTSGNILGNSLIYDNGTNVGIGTTSPNYASAGRQVVDINGSSQSMLALSVGGVGKSFLFYTGTDLLVSNESNGAIKFNTNGSEKAIITSSGNVGIGTTSPSQLLEVNGTIKGNSAIFNGFSINNTPVSKGTSANFTQFSNTGGDLYIGQEGNTNGGFFTGSLAYDNVFYGSRPFNFIANAVSRMYITSSGNVGIGTTAPTSKLHLYDNATVYLDLESATASSLVRLKGGTYSGFSSLSSGVNQWFVSGGGASQTLVLGTADTERMRITSGGVVCIGTTSAFDSGIVCSDGGTSYVPYTAKIGTTSSSTQMFFRNPNGIVGSISTSGSLTSFNVTSDYRLKQDFKSFNGLDLVSKIKVYDYAWKADNSRMNGVIAHELQEVVPYAVTGEKDAEQMQSVDYSKLVPLLIASIQELKAEIEILKNK